MSNRLQQLICTRHNLEFGFDAARVKALGHEPAHMACPICARAEIEKACERADEAREHRDILLRAIEVKLTVAPAGKQDGGA